jgi:NAD(P)-dependent dehydrogenase (short-subunit alcohol dehydrogenase family)
MTAPLPDNGDMAQRGSDPAASFMLGDQVSCPPWRSPATTTTEGTAMKLQDKTALVTGGAGGIGAGIVRKLAEYGARVMVADVQLEGAQQTAQAVGGIAVEVDLATKKGAEGLVARAYEEFGELDILVNNAGINRDAMLHKMTDEQWDTVLTVDLGAVFYTTRAAGQRMRERGYGRIVNISSGSWLGNVGQANYAAAKAGVIGLSKTAARELARKGVTVNVICPGFIDTQMTLGMPDNVRKRVIERIPIGQPGVPEDVGAAVAFFASDEAAYITGVILDVGGGYIV